MKQYAGSSIHRAHVQCFFFPCDRAAVHVVFTCTIQGVTFRSVACLAAPRKKKKRVPSVASGRRPRARTVEYGNDRLFQIVSLAPSISSSNVRRSLPCVCAIIRAVLI